MRLGSEWGWHHWNRMRLDAAERIPQPPGFVSGSGTSGTGTSGTGKGNP